MSRFDEQHARGVEAGEADAAPVTKTGTLRGSPNPPARADDLLPLARAAAGGAAEAASTLAAHVGGPMLKVIRKVLGRRHPDVDDVAQDAMIAFLHALGGFRGECAVVGFAQRIALLTALGARRRARARGEWSEAHGAALALVVDGDGEGGSPLGAAEASRRRALVRAMLDELPDVIGEALALHFILGYTVEEIAAALVISPNTVWSRLRLGKRALRRKLSGDARLREMLADRDAARAGGKR